MVAAVKEMVRKATGLFSRARRLHSVYWPAGVLSVLEVKFQLKPEDMLRLGYLQRRISQNENTYYTVFIYDRLAAFERKIAVKSFRDIYDYPELLLYKGNMFRDGTVYLGKVKHYETN